MGSSDSRCESCGALLSAPDALCEKCYIRLDAEFSKKSMPDSGKYICPTCSRRFSKPLQVLWPTEAAWYKLKKNKSQCPHCQCFLKQKKRHWLHKVSSTMVATVIITQLVLGFPDKEYRIFGLILLAVFLVIDTLMNYRQSRDSHLYEVDADLELCKKVDS